MLAPFFPHSSCVAALLPALPALQSAPPALAGQCYSAGQHNVLDTVHSPNHRFVNGALVRGFISRYCSLVQWRPVQTAAWWVSLFPPLQLA